MSIPSFPTTRMRRARRHAWMRRLVAENHLTSADLIWPVFIQDGTNTRTPIPSMPGVARLTLDLLTPAVVEARELGIPLIALFPVTPPQRKTPDGEEAVNPDNLVCRAVRALKKEVPDIGIMCDVALDPYTSHGHDGL